MIDVDLGSNLLSRFWCSLILCKLLVFLEVAEGEFSVTFRSHTFPSYNNY